VRPWACHSSTVSKLRGRRVVLGRGRGAEEPSPTTGDTTAGTSLREGGEFLCCEGGSDAAAGGRPALRVRGIERVWREDQTEDIG